MSHTIFVPIFKQAYMKAVSEKTEVVIPFIDGNVIIAYFSSGGISPDAQRSIAYNCFSVTPVFYRISLTNFVM